MARAWERVRTASGTAWQTTEGTAREIALISYRRASVSRITGEV
jgi:hypothetical protein